MKQLIALISALTFGAALPATAGSDAQIKQRSAQATQTKPSAAARRDTAGARGHADCAIRPFVKPLDHGPNAQTTPGSNQLRKQRFEAEIRACRSA